jgi:hypothetical protein
MIYVIIIKCFIKVGLAGSAFFSHYIIIYRKMLVITKFCCLLYHLNAQRDIDFLTFFFCSLGYALFYLSRNLALEKERKKKLNFISVHS